ncbi:MAG: hypothetical protein NTX53_21320 [candidate division WOR-3 bacterium]|nr:hypothetical protein [candidate division WOR-3 bacterium]
MSAKLATVWALTATLFVCCKGPDLLRDTPAPETIAENPTWAPDGSKVFYGSHGRICSVDMQGNVTNVSENWNYYSVLPDVSPDGNWLLFASAEQIRKARLSQDGTIDTSTIVALTDRGSNFDPAWSPDGQMVAYVSNLKGDSSVFYGICIMDADGTDRSRLPDSGGDARNPRWSPDGSMLVYHGYVGHDEADILVTSVDGTGRRLLTDDTLDDVRPDWSPNGQTIAFARRGKSPGFTICLVDTAGQGIEEVTTGHNPKWSPDGQSIVFEAIAEDTRGDYSTLFVMDLKSGDRRQLVWR